MEEEEEEEAEDLTIRLSALEVGAPSKDIDAAVNKLKERRKIVKHHDREHVENVVLRYMDACGTALEGMVGPKWDRSGPSTRPSAPETRRIRRP
jgi:hypothetical protein